MNSRGPDGNGEPEDIDQVMLAVLANRGRDATVLSADQERLLDNWVDGRLPPDAAEGAASLVKQNSLAAERVLERRLLAASERSPSVPQDLTARVLKSSAPPRVTAGGWWRLPRRWQWTGLAGAVALASIMAIVGIPLWQQTMQGGTSIQVAMVTIADRTPLFESSDVRMRGTGPQQGAAADQRFRDVEMPTGILRNLIATAGQPAGAASREIEAYLPAAAGSGKGPVRVILDSALKERVEASDGRDRMPVRIYDLEDPRTMDIQRTIGTSPTGARVYLLTLKP